MIRVTTWTHVGLVRDHNEDAIALPGVVLTGSPQAPITTTLPIPGPAHGGAFVAVIDGMGGHVGGAEASALIARYLTQTSGELDVVLAAINAELYDEMDRCPQLVGMGATVAGFRLSAAAIEAFNVGDARIYRHADGYASLVSVDDRSESGSGEITQSLGGTMHRERITAHVSTIELSQPQRLLACSDGLSEYVKFGDLQEALDIPHPEHATRRLIELALEAGAPDNVSVLLLESVVG